MNKHPHKSTTTPERFFHYRGFEANRPHPHRGQFHALTIFVRKDKDGKWYGARAECDSRDQFCRRTGRLVARRKWFAGKRYEVAEPTYDKAMIEAAK